FTHAPAGSIDAILALIEFPLILFGDLLLFSLQPFLLLLFGLDNRRGLIARLRCRGFCSWSGFRSSGRLGGCWWGRLSLGHRRSGLSVRRRSFGSLVVITHLGVITNLGVISSFGLR